MRPLIIFMTSLAPTGGIERDALKCIRALAAQGRTLHIAVAFLHPDVPNMLEGMGDIRWHRVRTLKRPPALGQWILWRKFRRLEQRLKRNHPDARTVCFEWMPVCDYQIGGQPPRLWWQARKHMGLRTWHRPAQRTWESFVEREMMRRGAHFAVYSEMARQAFHALGVPDERISRVIIPTDLNVFSPVEEDGRKDILIVGSNPMLKGIDLALNAWPAIHAAHPELRLNIVGKGWKLRQLVERQRLPGVRLSPLISEPQRYYHTARLVWAPSRFETWCNVVPEALACGVPVITSTQTPSSELIDHPNLGAVLPRSNDIDADARRLIAASMPFLETREAPQHITLRRERVRAFQDNHQDMTQWITNI